MAYRKFYKRRYRTRRKRAPWYKKKYSAAQMASKALKGVNYIRGLVNSERFYHDYAVSPAPTSSVPTVRHLSGVIQADGDNNRTGNSIFVKSLSLRMLVKLNVQAIRFGRIMIVRDTQQVTDTNPTASQVLQVWDNPASIYSFLNTDQRGRFDVLADVRFGLNPEGKDTYIFNRTIPMRSHIRFNGPGSTDIQKNGLYLLCFVDSATASDVTWLGTSRIYFHDN